VERLTNTKRDDGGRRRFAKCIGCKENCYYCQLQQDANDKFAEFEDAMEKKHVLILPENPTNFDKWRMNLCPEDLKGMGGHMTFLCQSCPASTCPRRVKAVDTLQNSEPPKCWDCFMEWANALEGDVGNG
jgi:hypothetical protein